MDIKKLFNVDQHRMFRQKYWSKTPVETKLLIKILQQTVSILALTLVVTLMRIVKEFHVHQKTKCQSEPEAGTGNLPHPSSSALEKNFITFI